MANRKNTKNSHNAAIERNRNGELAALQDWIDGYGPAPAFVTGAIHALEGLSPEADAAFTRFSRSLWRYHHAILLARAA